MKEIKTLWEYKNDAHAIIDELIYSGLSRGYVYKLLRQRLNCRRGEEHIRTMSTIRQVKRALYLLNKMRHRFVPREKNTSNRFISGHKLLRERV